MARRCLNIAHRGASGRFPENTLAAFRAAIEAGADMCELDVQLTRDGAVMVLHDKTLDRTTDGRGPLSALTLEQVRSLNVMNGRGRSPTGEHVPTLDEVFGLVRGRCALNIELKADGVEAAVCRVIRDNDELESSIVSSFDWGALERVRKIEPQMRIGVLADRGPNKMLAAASELKAVAVNPRFSLVDASLCAEAHRRGLYVYVWTVDDVQTMWAMLDRGVDGIMTNYPERLRVLIEG
jgi:glycerophosphoryl diester phosphodiesterase